MNGKFLTNKYIKAICKKFLYEIDHQEELLYYFDYDVADKIINIMNDIEKRFKAYEIALKNGFMTPSEVRFEEDLNEIETLNFVKLNLGDVLMDIASGSIYTPNTNTKVTHDGVEMNQSDVNVVQNGAGMSKENIKMK